MMFGEMFDIYCENYVEHVVTVYLQNAEFRYIIIIIIYFPMAGTLIVYH